MIHIVVAQSGVHGGSCLLGCGKYRIDAMEDAYGPDVHNLPKNAWFERFESVDEAVESFPNFETELRIKFT